MSIELTIDGATTSVPSGYSLLQAADSVGVYVPRLCAHPGLATRGHCGVCIVECAEPGICLACDTEALSGMAIITNSAAVQGARVEAIRRLLVEHPHVCLFCETNEGCSRSECAHGTPREDRCCGKFGVCELQKVVSFIGIPADASRHVQRALRVLDEGNFTRDLNLCLGCLRCEDACRDIAKVGALGHATVKRSLLPTPSHGYQSLKEAGCVSCGACVEVCPTGALLPKKGEEGTRWLKKVRSQIKLQNVPAAPPRSMFSLDSAEVSTVPAVAGVYKLYSSVGAVYKIRGVINLREALHEDLKKGVAVSFSYEVDPAYTLRETRIIQAYVAEYGEMPGGDDLGDLF